MEPGSEMPDVAVVGDGDAALRLRDLPLPALVYFYPRDDTPGCTREALDFGALAGDFAEAGVSLLGISRDTPASHAKFAAKHGLVVALASDVDGSACEGFGVWGEKRLYGRSYMGVERATFLFGADGRLARAWRTVRVPGHAEAVLAEVRTIARGR